MARIGAGISAAPAMTRQNATKRAPIPSGPEPITSVAANLAAIIGGILVFHEPIGSGPLEIGARFLAFCLVIAGAALMPAPMRVTPDAASMPGPAPSHTDPA